MSSELSVSLSTRRKFIQPKFTEDMQHSIILKPTVFEVSNIVVNSSTAAAKTYTMIRGPEDLRLIISMPKLLHAWRGTVLFVVLAGRGPGRVARNRLDLFAQFCGNENFHLRCVPHQLTDDLRQVRVAKCGEPLRPLETMQ
jgi:hypothetical protein